MSLWALLFIGLAVMMAIGPVMLMQPSRRERHLAGLRQQAAQLGLSVRMAKYPDTESGTASDAVAVYSLPVELPSTTASWQLIRRSYSHNIHFYGHWDWQRPADLPLPQQGQLKQLLDDFPSDIVGIELSKASIGIWWRETAGVLTIEGNIKPWLLRCHGIYGASE